MGNLMVMGNSTSITMTCFWDTLLMGTAMEREDTSKLMEATIKAIFLIMKLMAMGNMKVIALNMKANGNKIYLMGKDKLYILMDRDIGDNF